MLVLSRHINERIFVGKDIIVQIVDIRGDKVRIGITAPKAVPVHREEVARAIDADRSRPGRPHRQGTEEPCGF